MNKSEKNKKLGKLYVTYSPMYFEKYLNDPNEYGKRVKNKRISMNLSTRQLAYQIRISHSQISKIENGDTKFINLDVLQTLSEEFNCSPLYLLGKSDSEKPPLKNYCYTNPYTNNILLKKWCSNINKSINRKLFINGQCSDLSDFRMRTIIDTARENKNGIKLQIDNQIYYITYLKKEYYIKNTHFRKERYVENKLFGEEKSNKIVKSLPKSNSFINHKELDDFLVIQNCSDIQVLAKRIDSNNENLLYNQKLQEIFGKGFLNYTNCNLIDYLFEIHNIKDFNENLIIKHLSRLLHTKTFDATIICKMIDSLIMLNKTDQSKVEKYISTLLSTYQTE